MNILASTELNIDIFENFWFTVCSNFIYTFGLLAGQFMYTPYKSAKSKYGLRLLCCIAGNIIVLFVMTITDRLQTVIFNEMPIISSFVLTISTSACLWICYKASSMRLVYSAFAGHLLTMIYMQPAKIVQNIYELNNNPPVILAIKLVSCLVVYIMAYGLFIRKLSGDDNFKPRGGQLAILIVISVCVLSLALLEFIVIESNVPAYLFLIVGETVLCVSVLLAQYLEYLSYEREKNMLVELELKKVEENQFDKYRQIVDALNIKYHDMKHHIRELEGKKTVPQEVLDELNKTAEIYDSFVKTGNATLDTVITEKSLLCHSRGIQFTCMLDGKGLSYISVYDINSLFGNALDNAIEYLEGVPAEDRYIAVTCRLIDNAIQISIANYTKDRVKLGSDGLPSTSKNRIYHGFGMRSMRKIVEKYGGMLNVTTEEHLFNLNILLAYKADG